VAEPTLNNGREPADLCRVNGWGVGTVLEGDEGYGACRIVITAVGEKSILAREVVCCGHEKHASSREGSWVLSCREWRRIEAAPSSEKGDAP